MRLEPAFKFIFSINAIQTMNVHTRLSATSAFLTFHAFRCGQFFRERIRSVTVADATLLIGGTTHDILDVAAPHQLVVREEVLGGRRAVDAQRLDVFVLLTTVCAVMVMVLPFSKCRVILSK